MKSFILLFSLSLLFASCTTAYKTSQTPDDVYFSPERPGIDYVQTEKNDDRQYRSEQRRDNDDYYSYDDSYLRMKVRNRQRWNYLDDPYYSYNPYAYRYYNNIHYYNRPWNNYSYWNYYYNPYAPNIIVVNPKAPTYNRPRMSNLNIYNNQRPLTVNPNATVNPKRGNTGNNNSRPRRDFGNDLRDVFGDNNARRSNNNSNSSERSTNRSSTNSSSGSSNNSSSGSSSGGNAPVRRF